MSTSWRVLAPSLLIGLLTWAAIPLNYDVSAAQGQDSEDASRRGKAEVVIIICQAVGTGTPIGSPPYNVTVQGVSRSGGGSTVQVGGECAQAVASVMSAGYRLRDVGVLSFFGGVQYTLIDR
jgi:hypothetical protein